MRSMLGALPECHAARRGAQDTRGVHGVHAVPVDFLRAQIDAVLGDIGADAVKTGMLPSVEVRPACVHPGGLAEASQRCGMPARPAHAGAACPGHAAQACRGAARGAQGRCWARGRAA